MKNFLIIVSVFVTSLVSAQQEYDLLLKNGHLIDPANKINETKDIAIKDGVVANVSNEIRSDLAKKVVDISGLYVSPGFIDLHAHTFHGTDPHTEYSNGFNAMRPDGFTLRSGVTTVVEAGGAGWRNFLQFKEQVIDRSKTRVLAFINIVGNGMKGSPYEQDLNDMDPKLTAMMARRYKEIVGIKIAHYNGYQWDAVERAVEAGERADLPVMVDFGSAKPALSLETLFMEKLRPGDIYTHFYGGNNKGRQAIVDENGEVRPFLKDAEERGIIFDVGHGGASFFYWVAYPAMKAGIKPKTISTDAHGRSSISGMKDMTNVISKFLNLGMSLEEVINAVTVEPSKIIKREDLGHLGVGSEADITVFGLRKGEFWYMDRTGGEKMKGDRKIENEMTIIKGNILWDLNGRNANEYKPN